MNGIRIWIVVLAITVPLFGQSTEGANGSAAALPGFGGQLYREIVDPSTGDRWLLLRDASRPGGPGRLILAGNVKSTSGMGGSVPPAGIRPASTQMAVVIQNGDSLVVERDTPLLRERLEAIAMGPAAVGELFEVRLKIGGRRFRAVALGAGRAAFADTEGGRP